MPRKKQISTTRSSEPRLKATPLRKSCRKTALNSKLNNIRNDDKNLINEISIENSELFSNKRNVKDMTNFYKLKGNSPESTDSGISFGSTVKVEIFPLSPSVLEMYTSEKQRDLLSKSQYCTKNSDVTKDSNVFALKKLNKISKNRRKVKRKIIDLNETDHAYDNTKKPNLRKRSKIVESKELIIKDKLKVNKVKPKTEFPSAFGASVLCMKEESILQVLTQHEFKTQGDVKYFQTKVSNTKESEDDSNSDSDWEEVEENKELNLGDYNPVIPKEGVEITIDCPEFNVRKRKKKLDKMENIRLQINRELRKQQLNTHKTHLLCLLAHGFFVNNFLNSTSLKGLALSLMPNDILALTSGRKINKIDINGIRNIVFWFRKSFRFENKELPFIDIEKSLINYFQDQKSFNASEYNIMFIIVARLLGFKTRFCVSLYPLTHKAKHLFNKNVNKKRKGNSVENSLKEDVLPNVGVKLLKKPCKNITIKSKEKKTYDPSRKSKSRPKRSTEKSYEMSTDEDDDDDEDFDVTKEKKFKRTQKNPSRQSHRNILPITTESTVSKSLKVKLNNSIMCWCEVYSKPDNHWISIECSSNIINEPYNIEKLLLKPVTYIVAFDNDSYIKDVTKRYCIDYMTTNSKLRVDVDWWNKTLEPFSPPHSKQDKEEEKKLDDILINKPLPKTISEFKNHPLYALKRHLLKFEAIYPPDVAPVGFLREEPIYPRDCVCKLNSREKWLKEARVVRAGQEPYKIVTSPKWDKINRVILTDVPQEIFGFWQTDPYEPPTAVDGKVPRNEYGNVDLFKPSMLPKGTVHLQIPGLNRIAKKLGIDCSSAIVGFNINKGFIHPIYDGFVVCQEFKDTLLTAWEEEQEIVKKREKEKKEKRIYGNWKKLTRGLLIREKIKLKYYVN